MLNCLVLTAVELFNCSLFLSHTHTTSVPNCSSFDLTTSLIKKNCLLGRTWAFVCLLLGFSTGPLPASSFYLGAGVSSPPRPSPSPPYPNKHKAGCWPAASSDSCSLAPQLMEAYLLVAPKPSMASTVSAGARGPARRCLVVTATATKVSTQPTTSTRRRSSSLASMNVA